jgi:hypothetical protein
MPQRGALIAVMVAAAGLGMVWSTRAEVPQTPPPAAAEMSPGGGPPAQGGPGSEPVFGPSPELPADQFAPLRVPLPEAVDEHPEARPGMFQKVLFDATWLAPGGQAGLGMTDLEAKIMLGVPAPTREWPMLITPGFAVHELAAPRSAGLPSRLYDEYVDFRWVPQITSRWLLDAAVTPGLYSDWEQPAGDGLRVTAHAAAVWTWTPQAKLVLGAFYEDRRDWNVIPIGGLLWNPSADFKLDLLFPQPKIAHRVYWFGQYDQLTQDWIYVAGEFADDVWAIQRADGSQDKIAYRDVRFMLGMERKVIHGLGACVEAGYVFSRKLTYYSNTPELDPAGTLLLRGGLNY